MSSLPKQVFSGKLMEKHRNARGISRMELARAIDFEVGPDMLRAYERLGKVPTVNTMLLIVRALNVKPQDLLENAPS